MFIVKVEIEGETPQAASGDFFTILENEVHLERGPPEIEKAILKIPEGAKIYIMNADGVTLDQIQK